MTFSPQPSLDRIQNDFGRLRKADRRCEVFGASQHRYKSNCWMVLVLEGIFRRTVWDMEAADVEAQWVPARRPLGLIGDFSSAQSLPALPNPPDFLEWLEWIEGWIEWCKLDFSIR